MVLLLHNPCSVFTNHHVTSPILKYHVEGRERRGCKTCISDDWWTLWQLPRAGQCKGCTQLTGKTHMGQTLPPQKRAEGCIGLKYIESIFIDIEVPMWSLLQKEYKISVENWDFVAKTVRWCERNRQGLAKPLGLRQLQQKGGREGVGGWAGLSRTTGSVRTAGVL